MKCKNCKARTDTVLFDARKHPNDEEYNEAAALWNNRKPVEDVLERLEKDIHPVYNADWNRAIKKAIDIIKEELM